MKVLYEAMDGEIFETESQCREYELEIQDKVFKEFEALPKHTQLIVDCGVLGYLDCDDSFHAIYISDRECMRKVNSYLNQFRITYVNDGEFPLTEEHIGTIQIITTNEDEGAVMWGTPANMKTAFYESIDREIRKFKSKTYTTV